MTTRRRPQEPRSTAPSTEGSDPLLLWRCEPLSAWLSLRACETLRTSAGRRLREHRYDRRDLEPQPRELRPCAGCPGVLELRARGETAAPRRIES